MGHALKADEIESFRAMLLSLAARLRGDLDQMTDEALGGEDGNLINVPSNSADVGTENYDQEFTLGLIQNEQATLEQIHDALGRINAGTYGKCTECGQPIAKARLQVLPYAPCCIDCARELEKQG